MKVCWTEEGNYFEGKVIDSYPVEDGTMLVVEAENNHKRFVLREWNTLIEIGEDGNAIEQKHGIASCFYFRIAWGYENEHFQREAGEGDCSSK